MQAALKSESRGRIIIVDDIPDSLYMIQRTLEMSGFEVCIASSGRELIQCMLNGRWDAILMDVNLPGEMGTHLVDRIKQTHPELPIAYLTAYTQSEALKDIARRQGIPVLDRVEMAGSGKLVEFLDGFARHAAV